MQADVEQSAGQLLQTGGSPLLFTSTSSSSGLATWGLTVQQLSEWIDEQKNEWMIPYLCFQRQATVEEDQ